ncbi:MAG TPA: cytochrome P450 [Longimicrobium sp.]|jgi:cytochrome P450
MTHTNAPPPPGVPLLKVLPRLLKDPPNVLTGLARGAGDGPLRLGAGPASVYVVTHPDHVQHVLVENNRNYWKGRLFNRASFVFGRGLVLNEGEHWLAQRRLMSPAFGHQRVAALVPIMAAVVRKKIARWEAQARAGRPVELVREMMQVTLEVIARTMFSAGVTDADVARIAAAFGVLLEHMSLRFNTFFLPEALPLPGARRARAALAELEGIVARVVAGRRAAGERPGDLLTMLLDARGEDGAPMSERQLRDEVVTTLFGGYEATADALAWTWHLLATNPRAEARLRFEVETEVAGEEPAFDELVRLEYTRRVAQESMRLLPPFWWILRSALGDDVVGGRRVPAGATVLLLLYATHRHLGFWDHPEAFDPDRFLPERVAARHRHAYLPFGAGQRACIGRHLAMLEIPLVLAMLARRFRLAPVPGRPVTVRALASLRARDGIWMRLERVERPSAVEVG